MEQIVYASRATEGFGAGELFKIIEVSARNNPDREITGFLIATPDSFLQLIEGPTERLNELLEVLNQDRRHHDLTVLSRGPVQRRDFPSWKMQRFDISRGNGEEVLTAMRAARARPTVYRAIDSFLRNLRTAA